MNKLFTFFIIVGCLFLFSCHRSILTNFTIFANEEDIEKFNVQDIDFNYINAKAKIDFNGQNGTVHIRMKKDSLIWISIGGFGIEVTRILIRQDSVFVIDRLKKENQFEKFDINVLNERFNLEMSFKNLQAIILGNLPYAKSYKDKLTKNLAEYYLLQQTRGNLKIDNHVKITTMKVEKVFLSEPATKASLSIEYNDFGPLDNYIFAYSSIIKVVLKDTTGNENSTTVNVNFTKVELTDKELNFPFNVPRRLEDRK
jgi:hypothetical protein